MKHWLRFCFATLLTSSMLLAGPAGLRLHSVQGETVTLTQKTHPVTIVVFWATWCPPCLQEIPVFISLYEKYHTKGLRIIGISLDDDPKAVAQFLKDTSLPYPVAMNSDTISAQFPEVTAVPTLFILDKDLKIDQEIKGLHSQTFLERQIAPYLGIIPPPLSAEPVVTLKIRVKTWWTKLKNVF